MSLTEQILTALPGDAWGGLRRVDQRWQSLKTGALPFPEVVQEDVVSLGSPDWDVVICGGTLGILMGCALSRRGWRVTVLEQGMLRGRDQEWNISRQELETFLDLELLTSAELEQAIATEFNPVRVQFAGTPAVWVRDVLNIGIDPGFFIGNAAAAISSRWGTIMRTDGVYISHGLWRWGEGCRP